MFTSILAAIEMFSWQHAVSDLILIAIILAVFFLRKFFIKYKWLDIGFRFGLVAFMFSFEFFCRFNEELPLQDTFITMLPSPLCTTMLFLSGIMLLSNSSRLHKLIYPLAFTGAFMSFVFLDISGDGILSVLKFFITHGAFLLGNLYMFFTRKSVKYTWKDMGYSCLFFTAFATIEMFVYYLGYVGRIQGVVEINNSIIKNPDLYPGITKPFELPPMPGDSLYLIAPPSDLNFIKEAVGQVGYTLMFIAAITVLVVAITLVTWLCTRKRKDDTQLVTKYSSFKFMEWWTNISRKKRRIILWCGCIFTMFVGILQWEAIGQPKDQNTKVPLELWSAGQWAGFSFVAITFLLLIALAVIYEFGITYEISKEYYARSEVKAYIEDRKNIYRIRRRRFDR